MTKSELIASVAATTGQKKVDVEATLEAITSAIIAADKTTLKGFGTFQWKTRPARKGVNPATGEKIDIPEMTNLKFKPSSGLRDL